jgi:hypothetical protein
MGLDERRSEAAMHSGNEPERKGEAADHEQGASHVQMSMLLATSRSSCSVQVAADSDGSMGSASY